MEKNSKKFNKNGVKKQSLQPDAKRYSKAKFRKDAEKENGVVEEAKVEVKQQPKENRSEYYRNLQPKVVSGVALGKVDRQITVILTRPTEKFDGYSQLSKGQAVTLYHSKEFYQMVKANDGRKGIVAQGGYRELKFV